VKNMETTMMDLGLAGHAVYFQLTSNLVSKGYWRCVVNRCVKSIEQGN
jgi:hypothetical protein